ncbi:But2 family protein [Schizosaccharomyces osmophilus]|uniref:But2 family protein n=1 Tax=Schizosaccharomyces osmophilus TaxID=2545709 RepID=A0AAE9WAF9_9SCHI|nr:But2 family protein [Schizosaccharomyces osmophilus]WBW72585.1 But2 family protein [Schizosaccharomyces osmophilus]
MKLFSSVSLSSALFSLLACSPISSLAAPLTDRSDIKQNEEFSVMSLRSGNGNVHFHSFYVGDNNNVYLDPYDNGNEAAKFTLADTYLLHEGFSAHLGDNGALYFQRNDEGSILGFDFGERIASGYALELHGQSPVACPIEENSSVYSVFFGKGNGNSKCVGFTALAIPNNPVSSSSSSSTAAPSNAAKI